VDERKEYELIYSHSIGKWLENHLNEIPESFRDLFKQFIRYCKRTGVKDVTLYTYLPKLRNFLQYLDSQGIDNICDIDEDLIYDFIQSLEENGTVRREAGARRYLEVIKKLIKMLYEKGVCPEDKMKKVYERIKLKHVERLPPTITLELINMIDEFIQKIPDLKYRTLYSILRETGARIGEVLRVKLCDVRETDIGYEIVLRRSKSKPRTVFVVKYQDVLRAWLSVHPGWSSNDRSRYYLIYGSRPDHPLKRSAINNYMQKLAEKLNYAEKFRKLIGRPYPWPHLLRHIRAYELVHLAQTRKLSEKEVRQLMGWKTPGMVDVYVELLPEDLKRAYMQMLGIQTIEQTEQTQEPIKCPHCGFTNLPGSNYCARCGCPLTLESTLSKIQEEKEERKELLKLLREIAKILKRGDINLSELFRELSP